MSNEIDLQRYMQSSYINGGRDWPHYDCWGLVRDAWYDIHGLWLPIYDGLNAENTLMKSRHHAELIASELVPAEPEHGVILAVVSGRVCEHVGICIEISGELYALETDIQTGPRVIPINKFIEDHKNVRCYAPT